MRFLFILEPKDSNGWASAMNSLLRNQEITRSYGETGRKLAEKEFSIDWFNRVNTHFIRKVPEDT